MADPTFTTAGGAAATGSDSSIASAAITTTTGRFLVAAVVNYGGGGTLTTSSVADTATNGFTKAGSTQGYDADQHMELWYTQSPITGNASDVVTATFSGATSYRFIGVAEFSLANATAMAYDAEATLVTTASGTTHTSNTVTTGGTDALIVGAFNTYDSYRVHSDGTGTVAYQDAAQGSGASLASIAYRLTDAAGNYTISVATGAATQLNVIAKSFTFTVNSQSNAPRAVHQMKLMGAM